ncbi:MAG TPA: hypothetical protein VGN72_01080 [Tepidisphaeraceae bacterium]|jgi:hypothetical protein|nr:hypothetical protein [Tepidisphaeraceae bacterium]
MAIEPIDTTAAEGIEDTDWHYGTLASVADFVRQQNLSIISPNGDGTIDATRVRRDGLDSDAYFNVSMRGGVYVVPITVDDVALPDLPDTHETKRYFNSLSDWDVAARLNDHRMVFGGGNPADIDKMMGVLRERVGAELALVKSGARVLVADRVPVVASTVGVFQFPEIDRRGGCRSRGGEFSSGGW